MVQEVRRYFDHAYVSYNVPILKLILRAPKFFRYESFSDIVLIPGRWGGGGGGLNLTSG